MAAKEALSIVEVATVLGCSTKTAYRLVDSGQLPAFRLGDGEADIRVAKVDLLNFRHRNKYRRMKRKKAEAK